MLTGNPRKSIPGLFFVLAAPALMALEASPAAEAAAASRVRSPKEAESKSGGGPAAAASADMKIGAVHLKALKARSIGPAIMGGRVSEIALDPENPYVFYVALGTGGLMKTSNNGGTFDGVFEKEAVASIGAVAVAPSDPKIVWVGTGEANDRNSSSWGDGVYRSTDSGGTWTNVGLKNSRTIARIAVHPSDPNTAWVAAMGDLWSPGSERGLFKTVDAGKTWKAVLQAPAPYTDDAGCGEVAIDPSDPSVVYATLYARRRTPWSFQSGQAITDGKDVGGIFKSVDAGASWRKLGNGLPGSTGRIGLAVSKKNPKILYAIVQSDEGGLSGIDDIRSKAGGVFRSEDAGESWTRVNRIDPRPFYFSQVRVDPENDQRLYVLGFMLHVSEDGGRSFREDLSQKLHPDCHALAIDPRNPKRLLLGTDGGAYQTFDGGKSWEHMNRMAAGEFYRINLDMSTPYRICGGLQDNLNWVGPSATRSKDGILNSDWVNVGGGDGFYCVFDPKDSDVIYAESQQGWIHRFNLRNGELKELRPEPNEGQPAFRFHWNSPLIAGDSEKGTMYLAGNRVFRLTERAERWQLVSPDLSTRDPEKTTTVGSGAESYGVVYTLAESPLKAGMLWAGTDDGKVWRTDDGAASWSDLTANLPVAVKGRWINRIEPGHHDAAVAYMAVDAHRSGDNTPLLYRTADAGRSWQSIASNLPAGEPVKVMREDPNNPNLLFAGTEFGLFVSLDRGGRWMKFGDLPTVAVDDLAIHPRDLDLVIATHGRSLFVVDDIRPLEALTTASLAKDAVLFPPRPAYGLYPMPGIVDMAGQAVFRGGNPPEGALITVFVKQFTGDPVKITVTDAQDQPVATLTAPGTPGFNRVSWDLKPTKDLLNDYGGEGQKFVKSGEYTVKMTFGKTEETQKVKIEVAEGIETR